jgi:DNA-binding beta-propeller fold protein YncE
LTLLNQNASNGWGLNPNTNTISLVHVPRLEIKTNIPVSASPQKVALSVNGKRLYVVSDVSNEVRVYSASNGQLIETVTVSGRPTDIALLPDGVTAYVTQSDTSSIAVLSLE